MFRMHQIVPRLGSRPIAPLSSWTQLRRAAAAAAPKAKQTAVYAHWTDGDKLAVSERYPLSAELDAVLNPKILERVPVNQGNNAKKTFNRGRARPKSGVHLRNQIVSPDLCDDILKYIAPSLEQHKGCDILDIHPGACLWSQKLHEYLKPRSHILLEPEHSRFKQWIDPLVDAPDSKYKLVTCDTLKLESWREVMNNENFPHQTYKKPGDPNGQELNPTLLVTGALAWDPLLPGYGFDSMAKQLYNHLSVAAWSNDIVNVFGPVRSLFWFGSEDFTRQIAKSMSNVQRASFVLELTQKMEVIALSKRSNNADRKNSLARDPQYEFQSVFQALKRGEEAGMVIPKHRRDDSHRMAELLEEATEGTGELSFVPMLELLLAEQRKGKDMSTYLGLTNVALINMEKESARLDPDYYLAPVLPLENKTKERPSSEAPDPDVNKEYRKSRSAAKGVIKTRVAIEEASKLNIEMMQLERKLAKLLAESAERSQTLHSVQDLDDQWHKIVNALSKNFLGVPDNEFDDRVSLRHSSPPVLSWDARPFESLSIDDDEVWPRNGLTLISTTPVPRPTDPDIPDFHEWLMDFATGIYQWSKMSVPDALDAMQHSLSDIIKDCPSLFDGDKGGRMNMKHFRVRMLTREMLEELTKAYMGWPFKSEGSDHYYYFRRKGRQNRKLHTYID